MSEKDAEDAEEDDAVYGGAEAGTVLLGVVSGPLEEPYLSDITTSRAGGPPVWCGGLPPKGVGAFPSSSLPTCSLCGSPLWLVAQVYAPFESSHRALHIFGCNQRKCALDRDSWRCFRTQDASIAPATEGPATEIGASMAAPPPSHHLPTAILPTELKEEEEEEDNEWDFDDDNSAAPELLDDVIATLMAKVTAQQDGGSCDDRPWGVTAAAACSPDSPGSSAAGTTEPFPTDPPILAAAAVDASSPHSTVWAGPCFPPQWLDTSAYEVEYAAHYVSQGQGSGSSRKSGEQERGGGVSDEQVEAKIRAFLAEANAVSASPGGGASSSSSSKVGAGGDCAGGGGGGSCDSANKGALDALEAHLAATIKKKNSSGGSVSGSLGGSPAAAVAATVASSSSSSSSSSVVGGRKEEEEGAKYEATPLKQRALLRFQATVQRCPSQGLRYDWGGEPLWSTPTPPAPLATKAPLATAPLVTAPLLGGGRGGRKKKGGSGGSSSGRASATKKLAAQNSGEREKVEGRRGVSGGGGVQGGGVQGGVPDCPGCGAPRAFECQLMPALLYSLHVDDYTRQTSLLEKSPFSSSLSSPAGLVVPPPVSGAVESPLSTDNPPPPPPQNHSSVGGSVSGVGIGLPAPVPAAGGPPESNGMDWGAIAVFSCSKSCSASDEEFLVVQPPLD